MTSCFPDINVWLALVVERHVLNRPAADWWNHDQSDAIGFCRFTQLGLLRHLINAATMKGDPLTNRQAWSIFGTLRVRFFPEWPALDGLLKSDSDVNLAETNRWGDAYLAAYAAVNGATLVSFDRDFSKYAVKSLFCRQNERRKDLGECPGVVSRSQIVLYAESFFPLLCSFT